MIISSNPQFLYSVITWCNIFNIHSVILIFLLFGSCNNEDPSDCAWDVCTTQIVTIVMTIKRADGSDVLLDSSKLVRLSDNVIIKSSEYPPPKPDWPTNLPYVLISDSYQEELAGKKEAVEFQGFINDTMIVKRTFIIAADCCHVYLASGNLNIVVN